MPSSFKRRALIGTTFAGFALRNARATDPIRMATWGGGNGKMWQRAFAEPFSKETGIPVTITEVVAPESQIRSDGDHPQYQVGIVSISEAMLLYKEGFLRDLEGVDLPGLADIPA